MENVDPTIILHVAERFGVPVAFAIIMVLLLVWFSSQHRGERGEWRDLMEREGKLNRDALSELSKAVNNLAVFSAYSDGKAGRRRK